MSAVGAPLLLSPLKTRECVRRRRRRGGKRKKGGKKSEKKTLPALESSSGFLC
jgi:hypothetical protein